MLNHPIFDQSLKKDKREIVNGNLSSRTYSKCPFFERKREGVGRGSEAACRVMMEFHVAKYL